MSLSCPICLEPFFPNDGVERRHSNHDDNNNNNDDEATNTALGAVDPCGHIFHFHCFALWKASQGNRCKCPECNQPAKKCIKLFGLARPEEAIGRGRDEFDDDEFDDDFTVSSNEDEDDKGRRAGPLAINHLEYCHDDNNGDDDDNNDERSVEVVEVVAGPCEPNAPLHVVDMTLSPPSHRSARPRRSGNNNQAAVSSEDFKRWKRAVRKYKGLYKQKDSQCRELHQQRQSLIELHSSLKDENNQLREEQEARQEMSELRNAQLDAANLKVVRLADDLKRIQGQIRDLTRERNDWNAKYEDLQRSFKKEVQRVKTSDMAEVQQMMEERRKLLDENERLVRDCAAAVRRESKVLSILRQAASASASQAAGGTPSASGSRDETRKPLSRIPLSLSVSLPDKKRKASTIAKELRSMEQVRFLNNVANSSASSRDDDDATHLPTLPSKMSARGGSLMEKVRQQQQQRLQQKKAVSTTQGGEGYKAAQTGGVLSDDTNRRILTESVRTTRVSQQEAGERKGLDAAPRPPTLGLKVSKSNNPFLNRR